MTNRWRLLLVAVLLVATTGGAGCHRVPAGPNIVLVIMDTARADHFSCYGYARPTTPAIDAFAHEAIRFTNAYSVSTWTVPSHASIFTGLYPITHGATQENVRLDDRFDTLAEILGRQGYETAAFSGNPLVSTTTKLSQGFHVMEDTWRQQTPEDPAKHPANRGALAWIRGLHGRPFFLFINYMEPHFPYEAPKTFVRRFVTAPVSRETAASATVRWTNWYLDPKPFSAEALSLRASLYDAELAFTDAILQQLLLGLKQLGVYDKSLIIITSDHGENLGDNGHLDHVFSLYNTTLHVPLIIRRPGGEGGGTTRSDPIQTVDLFATVLHAAGVPTTPAPCTGSDLMTSPPQPKRPIIAEYYFPAQALDAFPPDRRNDPALKRFRRHLRSIEIGEDKLILGSDGKNELYELGTDPHERHNLSAEAPEKVAELHAKLVARMDQCPRFQGPASAPTTAIDAATRERLRALGYLD